MVNLRLKGYILEAVDNQLKDNDPKCVNETFEKLIGLGYTENSAKKMIATVLTEEIYDVMKNQQQYNEEKYSSKLSKLLDYTGECIEDDKIVQNIIRTENKIGGI